MQLNGQPPKLELPIANDAASRASIPVSTPAGPGRATQQYGFPPETRQPIENNGVPPDGTDMNGMLYLPSATTRWLNAGGGFQYDATWCTSANVSGYPKGARVLNAAGDGYWLNLVDGNTTNPDSLGAGWVPDGARVATISVSGGDTSATAAQASAQVLTAQGTLTGAANIVLPAYPRVWTLINATSGAFSLGVKVSGGSAIAIPAAAQVQVYYDGTTLQLLNLQIFGQAQTEQDLTASRALGTTYVNFTGRPILVNVELLSTAVGVTARATVNGVSFCGSSYPTSSASVAVTVMVRPGASYSVPAGSYTLVSWKEIR